MRKTKRQNTVYREALCYTQDSSFAKPSDSAKHRAIMALNFHFEKQHNFFLLRPPRNFKTFLDIVLKEILWCAFKPLVIFLSAILTNQLTDIFTNFTSVVCVIHMHQMQRKTKWGRMYFTRHSCLKRYQSAIQQSLQVFKKGCFSSTSNRAKCIYRSVVSPR